VTAAPEVRSRSAIITGGSSGIGLAIAEALFARGYNLTLVARDPSRLEAAAKGLDPAGQAVRTVAADVRDPEAPDRIVATHVAAFNRLDVLVNGAGVGVLEHIDELSLERIDMQFEVCLRSAMLLSRASVEHLRASASDGGPSLIVNVSSASAREPETGLSVYSSMKSALVNFTRATNRELGRDGIRATAVCPGFVDTPLVEYAHGWVKPEDMIRASDVAQVVTLLTELSRTCVLPVVDMERPGGLVW
jgi:3-oxoacyl-[acyl-carrier protein] reductase